MGAVDRGDGIAVDGVNTGEGGCVVLNHGGGENLEPTRGLSMLISSVALVRVRILQVLQKRQSDAKPELFYQAGHLYLFGGSV